MDGTSVVDLIPIITILAGSGGVGTFITWYYDTRMKNRGESLSMAKFKMEKIDNKYNDYWDLINNSSELSSRLERFTSTATHYNQILAFLTLLKFSQSYEKINACGSFLLSNQSAETVIDELAIFVTKKIRVIFPGFDYRRFIQLDSTLPIDVIEQKIMTAGDLFNQYFGLFSTGFGNLSKEDKFSMIMTIRCISHLLGYELNSLYEKWYEKEFKSYEFLSNDSREYILRTHDFGDDPNKPILLNRFSPDYFNRIF